MYQFVDTTKYTGKVTTELPSEAMRFNGEYIENQIDGYRTLYVRGRESMLAEINAYETGVRDGTGITSKRFPARELVIGYLLRAESNEAFRNAYNALNSILNTQDAQIIFRDEEDKYFTGTPEGLDEIESGRNFVQGEIIIYCADPFKYGVKEKTASTISESKSNGQYIGITYNGTYKAFPRLEAIFPNASNGNPDCGFVAWTFYSSFANDGKVIQLGDPNEEDLGEFNKAETLISQTFNSSNFPNPNKPDGWDVNYGGKNSTMHVNVIDSLWGYTGGTFLCSEYLMPNTFEYEAVGYWTGMNMSCEIPADSNGVVGATEWKVSWKQLLSIGTGADASTCRGGIQVIVTDKNDTVIAAANMYKGTDDSGNTGRLSIHTKSTKTKRTGIDMSNKNQYWGSGGLCTMTKSGSKVSFNLGGLYYSLTDADIADMKATRVTIVLLKRSAWPHLSEGVYELSLQKTDVSDWKDVTNSFGRNDTAVADCASGKITINGRENASYGDIGNNWETFCLYPGSQNIRFTCSDWCENQPSARVYYREVFI